MNNQELLDFTKRLLDKTTTEEDGLIQDYLTIAREVILYRIHPFKPILPEEEIPTTYHILQCRIAVDLYNKRGAEGEIAHGENGINRTYESANVSKSLLKEIIPKAGVL